MTANSEQVSPDDAKELIWTMLDEQISTRDFERLESLLVADADLRRLYVECVQLHVSLEQWFQEQGEASQTQPISLPIDLPFTSNDSALTDSAF